MRSDEWYQWLEERYPKEKGYRYRGHCGSGGGRCPVISQYHHAKDGTITWLREFVVCPCREKAKESCGPVWTIRR